MAKRKKAVKKNKAKAAPRRKPKGRSASGKGKESKVRKLIRLAKARQK